MGPANTHKTNNVENNIIKLIVNLVHLLYYIQYYFHKKRELISKALKYLVLRSRRIKTLPFIYLVDYKVKIYYNIITIKKEVK